MANIPNLNNNTVTFPKHARANQAISADEKFQRIGLEKLAQLAQFIESFEAPGFDVETVRKLAEWKRALAVMGINPNTLEQYIKEKGRLKSSCET